MTLEQISRETKIPSRHLDSLEHGQLAAVPGGVPHAGDAAPDRADTRGQSAAAADAAAEPELPAAAVDGTLVVTTDPPGARVTVNGIGRGATPLTMSNLPLGELRLRISRAGYESEERVLRLEARRSTISLHVTLGAVTAPAPSQ